MDNEEKSKAFVKKAFNGFYTFSLDLKTSSNLLNNHQWRTKQNGSSPYFRKYTANYRKSSPYICDYTKTFCFKSMSEK